MVLMEEVLDFASQYYIYCFNIRNDTDLLDKHVNVSNQYLTNFCIQMIHFRILMTRFEESFNNLPKIK